MTSPIAIARLGDNPFCSSHLQTGYKTIAMNNPNNALQEYSSTPAKNIICKYLRIDGRSFKLILRLSDKK